VSSQSPKYSHLLARATNDRATQIRYRQYSTVHIIAISRNDDVTPPLFVFHFLMTMAARDAEPFLGSLESALQLSVFDEKIGTRAIVQESRILVRVPKVMIQ
jgi:hypothetical protein